ncbi:MAG: TetR/AcrR family transcriptional regulator [Proteobacteria bacterium]|nr:TetR/AcrR family transcriptional regulator [Desulfobacterales bacterium]MBL6968201.1 TetR/AcrR family transcriptional regulator [Desulfobacteraceae bacterium]MBU0735964.1 TetR/AcrR family transcriptional regulator [Pseudomonadota bacterium]MBL7102077.1 TetR/AcrR family transcriptional regulator [Desulfobacteraceae bacterium]MBL7172456.1 TetR/AcrR family transcriptional regulator [Desulfobacteraceae bacterium]
MVDVESPSRSVSPVTGQPFPPGRIKIAEALRVLLESKDFGSITTAEIARTAGVTEALIYKYFRDKKDLLYQVLSEYLEHYDTRFEIDVKGIKGALNRLRKLIWSHINVYATDRVFAKILLIEVRSFSDYYTSKPYELVKKYSNILLTIIEEGIANGEIREGISPSVMRQVILGALENVCLTGVVFDRQISPDDLTESLCDVIFGGIEKKTAGR